MGAVKGIVFLGHYHHFSWSEGRLFAEGYPKALLVVGLMGFGIGTLNAKKVHIIKGVSTALER